MLKLKQILITVILTTLLVGCNSEESAEGASSLASSITDDNGNTIDNSPVNEGHEENNREENTEQVTEEPVKERKLFKVTIPEKNIHDNFDTYFCEYKKENCVNCKLVCQFHLGKQLVRNGSFEKGHDLTKENTWGVYKRLKAWRTNLKKRDAPIEVQYGKNIGGIAPKHGNAKVELDSHNKDGYTESDVSLFQRIKTEADKHYLLTFHYVPRSGVSEESSSFELYWNNELLDTVSRSNTTKWKRYRYIVSAEKLKTKLEFLAHADSDNKGGYLDKVSVREITLPN